MLIQSLISVPFNSLNNIDENKVMEEETRPESKGDHIKDDFMTKSSVFFIGTHKDKVSPQRIEEVNKQLLELIRDTPQYRAHIVQHCISDRVIFAVDNFSSLQSDEDFLPIRKATQGLMYGNSCLKVKAPTSWLFTGIVLQNLSESLPILPLTRCKEIARQCGIDNEGFESCLKFLHQKIGIVRYYHTEHLRDLVILKPQLIINLLSQLMKRAFLKPSMQKAIINDDDINEVVKDSIYVKKDVLLEMSHDLLLTCPHPDSTANIPLYYLTCMLPVKKVSPDRIENMAVFFTLKEFVLPTGVGRAVITAIMQQRINSAIPWRMSRDTLYRNSLEFTVGHPAHSLPFKIKSTQGHISLSVSSSLKPNDEICTEVRQQIESIMTEVLKLYSYGDCSSPTVAFICPDCDAGGNSSLHYATLISEDEIQCSITLRKSNIPQRLKQWVMVRLHTLLIS